MYVQVIILVPRGYHVCTSYNISSPGVSCMHKLKYKFTGGIMFVQVIMLVPRGYHVCTSYNISSPEVSCMYKL